MEQLMKLCNNYFYKFKEEGNFLISDNTICTRGAYCRGQYIRIIGSVLNDGIYKIARVEDNTIHLDEDLSDEMFTGVIVGLGVPKAFIELCEAIKKYDEENKPSDYTSESFTGYSYTKALNKDGSVKTGKDIYAKELKAYRCNINDIQALKYVRSV